MDSSTSLDRRGEPGSLETGKSETANQLAALVRVLRSDRSAQAFVLSVWLVMMLVALAALLRFGRNIPLAEDWLLVSPLTGNEPNLINWLWALNNEHRIPLPRLVMLVLLKATRGDFRAGMLFSIVTLGALSLATIRVARSIRGGRTSYADAFFPVAFLHLGNWENLLWSWQLSFVLSMLLACWLLFVLVSPRGLTTPGGAVVAGISLVLLPLTGATGLLFVPVLALWLGYSGVVQWSRATTHDRPRWIGVFLIAAAAVALCLVGLYFVGYERPAWAPPNPGVRASLWAALQFLALGFGPIARSFWTPSTLAAIGVLLPTAAVAVLAVLRHRGLERHRALRMLAFFGSMVVYALAVGWGRAGAIEVYGGWPLRYVLLANLALCTVFFIWELYGPSKLRTVVQYGLFLAIFLLLPFNTVHGLEWRNYYRNGMEAVEQDILSGTPRSVLAERHRDFLIHWWDVDTLEAHMQMLQDSGFGPFADLQEASVVSEDSQPPPGGAIDEQSTPTQVQTATRAADTPPVSQEIRYHSAEATEVFLVWGINGWNVAPEGTRPDGTVIQNEVMHTPMVQEGGVFIAKVQVPLDTTIDYGFLITRKRGSPDAVAPIWDGSQDYQVIATADGIVEAKATPTLVKEVSRVLDSRHLFLIGSVILASAWFSIYFLLGLRDRQVKLEDTPQ